MADSAISVFLELRDKMSGGLKAVGGGLSKIGELASVAQSKLDRLNGVTNRLALGLGALGGALGGAAILRDVVKINEEFENTSIRIAGTLKAFDLAPTIELAQGKAAEAMKVIQDMAAALPGETEEYVTVFATALPKAIAAGMTNTTQIAKFTSSWMALASANMVDAQQAGMDLFRLLSGQAGADVRMFTVLAEKIGMTADAYNKMVKKDPAQAVVKIQAALASYADQQRLAADTFNAKLSEFESRIKEIKRLASSILFEKAKTGLAEMNAWLEKNKGELIATGREIADKVVKGFEIAAKVAKVLAENIGTVLAISTTLGAIWVGGSLAASVLNLIKLFTTMTAAATAATAASTAAAAATSAGPGGIAGIAGAAAAQMTVGQILIGTVGTVAFAAGAAALFASSLTEFAKGQAALQSGGMGVASWEQEAFRTGRYGAAMPVTTVPELSQEMMKKAKESLIYSGKYQDLQAQLDRARYGDLKSYEREAIAGRAGARSQLDALREMYAQAVVSPMRGAADEVETFAAALGISKESLTKVVARKPAVAPADRAKVNYDFRHSRFDIRQEFAEGFDPDRIAVAFASDLSRVGEMRVQSGYAPLYTG